MFGFVTLEPPTCALLFVLMSSKMFANQNLGLWNDASLEQYVIACDQLIFWWVSLFTGTSLEGNQQTQSYQATKQLGGLGSGVEM